MANRDNTDFLRFNAFSIKDLIIRKLAQDSNFTDQIYAGSNLNILIDIVSYMYQTLMFNLNSAAAESMWSDTKIYENINRLCGFLGYNPHGMNPATAIFAIPTNQLDGQDKIIPRYSYIESNKMDSSGRKIYYSTVEDTKIFGSSGSSSTSFVTLYNGRWKLYDTVFTAEGTDWETFVLNGLRSDTATGDYVANNYVHVYVFDPTETVNNSAEGESGSVGRFIRYNMTDGGLFKSRNEYFSETDSSGGIPIPRIYNSKDCVFNLRLNENKTYEITFGNNRQGRRLNRGSLIYVFYLDSNGPGSDIALEEITGSLVQDWNSFNLPQGGNYYSNIYRKILNPNSSSIEESFITDGLDNVVNITPSLNFSPEETTDQIRDFAPNWFRMGNRLVTQRDYEYYLNNSPAFREKFSDVKCMNNWGYMSTFYKWLYEMGIEYSKSDKRDTLKGRRFLRQDNLLKSFRKFADPADSNNIYLWIVPNQNGIVNQDDISTWLTSSPDFKDALLQIKDLTHEPYFVPAVLVNFAICAPRDLQNIRKEYLYNNGDLEKMYNENYIEITIADEVIYVNSTIESQVKTILFNFFRSENFKLGQYVDFNELQNQIFSINGVNRIRTVYKDPNEVNPTVVRNGLSFASWTSDPILQVQNRVEGIDLDISAAGRSLEPFQFPTIPKDMTIDKIKVTVIKRSAASFNTVAY